MESACGIVLVILVLYFLYRYDETVKVDAEATANEKRAECINRDELSLAICNRRYEMIKQKGYFTCQEIYDRIQGRSSE